MKLLELEIKSEAMRLGFDRCGIASAALVPDELISQYNGWIGEGCHAEMSYMERNIEKRFNPSLLVEGTKSLIVVALNYFPAEMQIETAPQFSRYAYGADYHYVMKQKLNELLAFIETQCEVSGRAFVDSAPVLERYWAWKAGIGFRGKNCNIIIPQLGSYFFLGVLMVDIMLIPDQPMANFCGKCTRCLEACPTCAIDAPFHLDAGKCLSYQTIEKRGEITPSLHRAVKRFAYGCDICQEVCPHNRFSTPHSTPEFTPQTSFLEMSREDWLSLEKPVFKQLFKHSAVMRAGFDKLKHNFSVWDDQQ